MLNLETPRALGAKIVAIKRTFEEKFQLDLELFKNHLSTSTKLVSITTPHNPTGAVTPLETLKKRELCQSHGSLLLIDETYGDMNFLEAPPKLSDFPENVISVSSLSKTYGLPGIRVGWLICRNKKLMETFLAAREQIFITGSAR